MKTTLPYTTKSGIDDEVLMRLQGAQIMRAAELAVEPEKVPSVHVYIEDFRDATGKRHVQTRYVDAAKQRLREHGVINLYGVPQGEYSATVDDVLMHLECLITEAEDKHLDFVLKATAKRDEVYNLLLDIEVRIADFRRGHITEWELPEDVRSTVAQLHEIILNNFGTISHRNVRQQMKGMRNAVEKAKAARRSYEDTVRKDDQFYMLNVAA